MKFAVKTVLGLALLGLGVATMRPVVTLASSRTVSGSDAASAGGQSASTASDPLPPDSSVIQHIVIIVQENRTPDNLFHGLPNADIANYGINSKHQKVQLTGEPLANQYDLQHSHPGWLEMYDNGQMDGADKLIVTCHRRAHCPPPHPQFKYVNPSDVAPYFQMAEQYTFADRMFQTNQGPSFPAHQFLLSGTSAPTPTSDLFASENPRHAFYQKHTGCTAPPKERVRLIDPKGFENHTMYPCYEHLTLADLLDFHQISWRYYTPSPTLFWTAPNAIRHLRFGPDWKRDVVIGQTRVLRDIAQGQLANVSWVVPSGRQSDHPGINDGTGPSWVASIVNAVGNSQYWANSVIFIAWDDWGGWYDHVAPRIFDSYEYGFRVPLIVVSPYAKTAYVSHVTHDFGSILKFTEKTFGLPSLGYADARADDLSDCFNFSQQPRDFHTIPAPYDANYFLNDKRPPTDPDDD